MHVKNKKILNLIMIISIVVIMLSGIMTVGSIKGWFDKEETFTVVEEMNDNQENVIEKATDSITDNKVGGVNIQRSGIAYALENDTKLRDGDIIQTLNGSSIDINYGKNKFSFNENSEAKIHIDETGELIVSMTGGEVFVNASELVKLEVMDKEITASSGVFSLSVPYGSANIYVFENALDLDGEIYKAGENVIVLENEVSSSTLSLNSLNDFNLNQVRQANEEKSLYFTTAQIEKLEAEREAAAQAETEAQLLEAREEAQIEQQRAENKQKLEEAKKAEENSENESFSSEEDEDEDSSSSDSEGSKTCTITIRCDTILENMDNLKSGKNQYVPSNGVILAKSKISFDDGDTVFDVLKKACSLAGIQLEYSWTPMYDSYYIEGINNLYEFDCGNESGWMYKVNGWFPNYGCSSYNLKEGDDIVWCYTCNGLGADVGGSNY